MNTTSTIALLLLFVMNNVIATDSEKGREVYLSYCIACHSFACNRDGAEAFSPKLAKLIGRKAGNLDGFTGYSDNLRMSEIIWTEEVLQSFFTDPKDVMPGMTNLEYHKVATSNQAIHLVAFLKTEDPSVDIFCKE